MVKHQPLRETAPKQCVEALTVLRPIQTFIGVVMTLCWLPNCQWLLIGVCFPMSFFPHHVCMFSGARCAPNHPHIQTVHGAVCRAGCWVIWRRPRECVGWSPGHSPCTISSDQTTAVLASRLSSCQQGRRALQPLPRSLLPASQTARTCTHSSRNSDTARWMPHTCGPYMGVGLWG